MAYQSIWYFTNLPEDVVEILDKDLYNNFDHQMQDSKLHGDALNKDKRNSKNKLALEGFGEFFKIPAPLILI